MADPTLVNGQITDAVTQTNVKILADAPGQALATLYQVMAHTVGIGMQNATSAQQNGTTLGQAAATQGVNLIYTLDVAADAVSTQEILTGNSLAQELASLNAALASNQQTVKTAQSTPGG
jgi:hypothetical protein